MLVFLLIFLLSPQSLEYKHLKELSGEIPDHPGITMETSAAEIARGNEIVKLRLRFAFPDGAPWGLYRQVAPSGFDVSSISRIEGKIKLNCKTRTVMIENNSSDIYQFNGKHFKSKEPITQLPPGHILAEYFCEQDTAPPSSGPPVLKKKP